MVMGCYGADSNVEICLASSLTEEEEEDSILFGAIGDGDQEAMHRGGSGLFITACVFRLLIVCLEMSGV